MPRLFLLLAALPLLLLAACGGDNGPSGSAGGGGGSGAAAPAGSVFIPPSPYTTEEALKQLDDIIAAVRSPDARTLQKYNISDAAYGQRRDLILNGESDVTGLDDARTALVQNNHILAAEYLENDLKDYVTPLFGSNDSDSISEDQLKQIDRSRHFVDDPSKGFPTTVVFKDVVVKMISLWYRL